MYFISFTIIGFNRIVNTFVFNYLKIVSESVEMYFSFNNKQYIMNRSNSIEQRFTGHLDDEKLWLKYI